MVNVDGVKGRSSPAPRFDCSSWSWGRNYARWMFELSAIAQPLTQMTVACIQYLRWGDIHFISFMCLSVSLCLSRTTDNVQVNLGDIFLDQQSKVAATLPQFDLKWIGWISKINQLDVEWSTEDYTPPRLNSTKRWGIWPS